MAMTFKGAHVPQDILLTGVRWSVASPLSTRHVAELMEERGVHVEHSTINRWVITYSPPLEEAFHRRRKPVWVSWRMDATYSRVTGEWRYWYRAVDQDGETVDVRLTEHRDQEAALRCRKQAIRLERLRDGHADARGHALAEGACGMIHVMLATSEPHLETGDFTQKQPDDSR